MPKRARKRPASPAVIPKEPFAREIGRIIADREITQTVAGYETREAPSQISLITSGHLRGFSAERLIRVLTRLGRDVDIRLSRARGRVGKLTVRVK